MFKLAHISDVHLSPLPKPSFWQLCSKRITGYLNWKMNRSSHMGKNHLDEITSDILAQNIDHIALTGDLVNLALPQEFENAEAWLQKLAKPQNLSVILGNHDAYVPSAFKRASQHFGAYMTSDDGQKQFPYLRIRDEVALIGVNSAEATLPFFATGYFRTKQAKILLKILKAAKAKGLYRIVMIHHPPVFGAAHKHKRLIGIKRFQEVIKEAGAELILHGHTHLDTLNYIEGERCDKAVKQVPVLCVPSASQALGGHKPAGGYNLLEIGRDKAGNWQCNWTARRIDPSTKALVSAKTQFI